MKLEIAHFGSLVSLVNHFDSERRFPCFVGTIFQNIKLPLRKWFYAMYLISSQKKGISFHQLNRDLGGSETNKHESMRMENTKGRLGTGKIEELGCRING